jgi:hypothetical protein
MQQLNKYHNARTVDLVDVIDGIALKSKNSISELRFLLNYETVVVLR